MPTPADLARARPKPPPHQQKPAPPPKGRIRADIEKERAQRALRSLVADPATDFAALPDDEFFAALKCACQDGIANPALIADAERRITSGEWDLVSCTRSSLSRVTTRLGDTLVRER